MSATATAIATLTAEVKSLKAEMISLREAVLAKPIKASPKASKKPKDPDAPKKEPSWWIKATQHVREALKEAIEADNEALVASGEKKLAGTVPVQVASMLKASGKLSADAMPEDEEIMEAYELFKVDPPESKGPAQRANKIARDEASVASSSGSSKTSTKFADLTEEEKTAARTARAIKAAATRKANKAAAEILASEASEEEVEEVEEPAKTVKAEKPAAAKVEKKQPVVAKAVAKKEAEKAIIAEVYAEDEEALPWKGDIGFGTKTYARWRVNGKNYMYESESNMYLGVWDGAVLDASVPDIASD